MSKAFTLCCTLDDAKAVREEVAFMQAVKVILTKRDISQQKKTNEERELGLTEDEVRFYDALANNESAVRELNDETLKKIAHELTENLRKNITVDWSARESIRAKLRIMVKRILKKNKYPPDQQDGAVELVLQQMEALGDAWA